MSTSRKRAQPIPCQSDSDDTDNDSDSEGLFAGAIRDILQGEIEEEGKLHDGPDDITGLNYPLSESIDKKHKLKIITEK